MARYNQQFALYLYTLEHHANTPDQQFYAILNKALRTRVASPQGLRPFLGVLYYIKQALEALPDNEKEVNMVEQIYTLGKGSISFSELSILVVHSVKNLCA